MESSWKVLQKQMFVMFYYQNKLASSKLR